LGAALSACTGLRVRNRRGAHLYFHGWEIEENDQWQKLEILLAQLAQRPEFKRITNGELYAIAAAAATK
jgi:hypothetical protein